MAGRLALAAMVALVAAGARAETGVTADEIVLGSCSPLSGKLKAQGEKTTGGAQLYFDHTNANGGVHGRKIKFVLADDEWSNKGLECLTDLVSKGIFAEANASGSAASATKVVRLAEAQKMPVVGFPTGAQFIVEPTKRYVFAVRPTFNAETRSLVEHLIKDLGVKKVAVIYLNDIGGIAQMDGVIAALKAHNEQLLKAAPLDKSLSDVDAAIGAVKATNPEAVFVTGPYPGAAEVIKKSKAGGWNPIFLTIGARDPLVQAAGDAGEGVVISNVVPAPDRTELKSVALYNKLEKARGHEPSFYGLEGFMTGMVVVEGLKKAGKDLTRESFVNALESLKDVDLGIGPDGKISYSKDDHEGLKKPYAFVIHNGKQVPLEDWKTQIKKK